jgi:hypothetical protein
LQGITRFNRSRPLRRQDLGRDFRAAILGAYRLEEEVLLVGSARRFSRGGVLRTVQAE